MLIVCDFDGTITERDVTDLVWNERIPDSERERMVSNVQQGHWSMLEYISHGYRFVRTPPLELLGELKPKVQIQEGWERFVAAARRRQACLHIVSNGLKFYVREYVPPSVPLSCYEAEFDGAYNVRLPAGVVLEEGEEFKVKCVRDLVHGHQGGHVVYIGDGRADFRPATLCTSIFAVRGSRLANECRANAIGVVEFESFDTLTTCLFPEAAAQLSAIVGRPGDESMALE